MNVDNKQLTIVAIYMQSQCALWEGHIQTNEMGIAMWTDTKVTDIITRLTCTVFSITSVTCATGTCKAAQGVSAGGMIATTTVVCCTFVDICEITTNTRFILKAVYLTSHT